MAGHAVPALPRIDPERTGVFLVEQRATVHFHGIAGHVRVFHAHPHGAARMDAVRRNGYIHAVPRHGSGLRVSPDRAGNRGNDQIPAQGSSILKPVIGSGKSRLFCPMRTLGLFLQSSGCGTGSFPFRKRFLPNTF